MFSPRDIGGFLFMQGIFFKDFKNSYIPEILKELYRERIYSNFIENKKDLVILDIGGNIGLFSQYAYPFAKTIYILEPSQTHMEVIEFMLNFNMMNDRVVPIRKALASTTGKTSFYHNDNVTMFSMNEAVSNGTKEEVDTVDLLTLLDEIKEPKVDFMKLDIEGSEAEVIGSESFQKACQKIDSMVVELHAWNGSNPKQIITTLRDYGYKVYPIPADAMLLGATRL